MSIRYAAGFNSTGELSTFEPEIFETVFDAWSYIKSDLGQAISEAITEGYPAEEVRSLELALTSVEQLKSLGLVGTIESNGAEYWVIEWAGY